LRANRKTRIKQLQQPEEFSHISLAMEQAKKPEAIHPTSWDHFAVSIATNSGSARKLPEAITQSA
jgi:hypothetical protein